MSTPNKTFPRPEANFSGWLNPCDFGASGSEYATNAIAAAGSNELLVRNPGDFAAGDEVSVDGCFAFTYGTLYKAAKPSLAVNQQPLTDELEINGIEKISKHRVFILHVNAPGVFSWMLVDPEYQTRLAD